MKTAATNSLLKKTSWTQAKSQCEKTSPISHMVVINREGENNFVVSIVPESHKEFWIGCSDRKNEGHWVCEDSSGMFFNVTGMEGVEQGYWSKQNKLCSSCYLFNYSIFCLIYRLLYEGMIKIIG